MYISDTKDNVFVRFWLIIFASVLLNAINFYEYGRDAGSADGGEE